MLLYANQAISQTTETEPNNAFSFAGVQTVTSQGNILGSVNISTGDPLDWWGIFDGAAGTVIATWSDNVTVLLREYTVPTRTGLPVNTTMTSGTPYTLDGNLFYAISVQFAVVGVEVSYDVDLTGTALPAVVSDTDPPVITVADIAVENDTGVCEALIAGFGASATDDSGTADLTFDIAEGTQFSVGTTTVTATATDPSGNSAQASFDVTVNDAEVPVLTLNGAASLDLNVGDGYTELGAVASDNCTDPAVVTGGDFVDTNIAGSYVVTYNVTDASGNAATQITRTVNVLDNVGPVITVTDINLDSEPGECGANIFDYGASATDPSGIADFNFSIPEGSFFDPGTTEVIAFASDNNGNVSQTTFNVTINDVEAPVLIARGITVELDENGFAELPPLNPEVILFQGTFDDDTPAQNTNSLVNWNVTGGNVDVYFANQFGSPFNDNALELAGSVNGAIESKETFTLEPGNYLFSFEARGFNGDAAIGIDIGTVLNTSFTNFTGSRQTVVFEFTVSQATTATIRLNEFGGGDAFSGTLLDNMLLQKLADSILITATDNCGIETITPSVTGFGCNELGTQQVTLTVRDEAGNEASETVDVEVVDNLAPTFATRESFIIFVDENGQASVTPADYNLGTVLDNCGVERVEFDRTEFGCGDVGFHVINVTAFDASGNITTTQADVEVRDEIAPEFLTRESFIIFVDANGEARLSPSDYNTGTIITNCDLDRIELSQELWGCGDVGFHVINVTAFDGNGLTTTTQADVEVRDEIAPEFLTRESFIIFVDANGEARLSPSDYNTGTIITNCDLDRIELSQELWGCGDVGFHVINVTAFDGNGLATTTQADVEVRDEITPVITLIGDATIEVDLGGPYFEEGADVADNCDAPLVIGGGVDTNTVGTYIVTYNAVDENGNPATEVIRTVNVIQVDVTGPVITANDITAFTRDDRCSSVVNDYGVTATDESGVADITFNFVPGTVFSQGNTEVVATATDVFGNVSTATFNVTVIDNVAPNFDPNDVTVVLDENGQGSITVPNAPFEIFADDFESESPGLNITALNDWNVTAGNVDVFFGGQFGLPTTNNSLELAGDVNGAIESRLPVFFEPGTYRLRIDYRGQFGDAAIGIDIGTLLGASIEDFTNEFFEPAEFDFVVTEATSATIRFNEFGGGTVGSGTLIDNVRILRMPEVGSIAANVYDNCEVTSITASRTDFTCADIGEQTVTVTVADAAGNTTSADIIVHVVDQTAPEFLTRESFIIFVDENGQASVTPADFNSDTVVDNCGVTNIEFDRTEFGCGDVGFHVINITATDAAGNTTVGQADVEVRDEIAPEFLTRESFIIFVDENGEARLSPSDYNTETIITNCDLDRVELSQELWGCGDVGFHVINVTAFDGNGLATTTQADVEVRDEIAPTFLTRESFIIFVNENGEARLSASDYNTETIITNCDLDRVELSQELWGCGDVGFHVINVTAFDGNGLSTTTQADVEVRDEIAPIFQTRESFILDLDENGQATLTPDQYNTETIITNCDLDRIELSQELWGCGDVGFHVINVTAIDGNGLATTTQADVEVRDEIAPVITLIGASSIDLNQGEPYFEEGADVLDNCDAPLIIGGGVDVNTVGTYIVTYNSVDENGNPAQEVIRTVNVLDVTGPVITANDITAFTRDDRCSSVVNDYGVTATDESGVADITFNFVPGSVFSQGTTEVVATATDVFGNVSTTTFNVTVIDNVAPNFDPNDITVVLDGNGHGSISVPNAPIEIFADDFESESPGLNITALNDWNVTSGNVDVIFGGQFGLPTTNNSLELAGDVNGAIESRLPVFFEPGTYRLRIDYRGQFGDAAIGIDIGTLLGASIEDFTNEFFEPAEFDFVVTEATSATIRFNEFGGGTVGSGTLIDNVRILRMPEVGSIAANVYDNCEVTSITASRTDFTCADIGEQTVTVTVADAAGNTTSADIIVHVVDQTAPEFLTRESFIIFVDENGQASVTPDDFNSDTVVDNCGVTNIEFDRTEFGCGDVGFHVINITATDAAGNTTVGQADVEVRDEIAPTFLTRESFIIFVDENGEARLSPSDYNTETIITNCDLDRVELSQELWGCGDVGFHVINVTAFDGNGLATTTQADVEVRDEIAPTFLTRESFIIFVNENGEARLSASDYNTETIITNCDLDRVELSQELWGCGDVGFHVINVTAFDGNGLATTTQADVEVRDEIAPEFLTRESFILDLDENGQATLTPDQYNTGTIVTNCNLDRVEFDRTNFNCDDLGFFTINVTAFDGNGLATTTQADVEVRDAIGPTARARDITVTLDEAGNATITPEDIDDGSSDNCGIESFILDRTVFDCDDIGEQNIVTLTIIDSNGISAQAQATVTVSDVTAPILEVQDITLALDANGQASLPALTAQTQMFYDGFSADDPALRKTELVNWNVIVGDVDVFFPNQFGLPFSTSALDVAGDVNGAIESKQSFLFEPGDYRLTFTVLGNNGDARLELEIGNLVGTTFTEFIGGTIETRSVDFTVTSTTSATIVFSEFGDEPFFSGTTIDDIELSRLGEELVTFADDACGVASIMASQTSFDCDDIGTQTVTVTATDANGNTSSATANVTIVDTTAPNVVAQDITVILGANGEVSISADDLNGGTTDNCDFTLSVNSTTFNCASLGENTVTLTATDGSGNTASADAMVTVVDNVGPVVNGVTVEVALDENGNASISLADVEGAISDNCGVATISIEATNFTCDDLGANSVNVTAIDANGNTTTGTITVIVIDIIPPVVVTEDIALTLDENGQAVITADDVLILSEDEIDTGEECTVSAAEHHAVWLSNYVRKSGSDMAQKRSGNDLGNHKWNKGRGKGRGRGGDDDDDDGDDDDDDDDRHHRPENTRFVFDADGGTISRNTDGTATVTGTIRSTANANDLWVVTLNLENGRNWDEWSALGRSYKDEAGLAHRRFENWTYFEMASGSKLTGAGVNAGDEIELSHAPADYRFGFQLGEAANSKNGNFGLSGWFFYTNRKGHVVQGDFNLDVTDCTPNTPPAEAMVTTDNCSLGDITLGQTVFTCADIGENMVEVTVADQSGNETTAFATVTISDDIAPVAVAQDITVSIGTDGTVTIDAMDVDGGSSDNCAIVSYSLSQDTFSCDDVTSRHSKGKGRGHNYGDDDDDNDPGKGKAYGHKKAKGQKVVLTVMDAAGNSSSAEAYVTVVDDLAPEISAEPVTIVVYGRKRQYLSKYDIAPAVTDNCEVKSIHFPRSRFDRSDVGMNTIMISAEDDHGNESSGLLNVNVVDITNLGKHVELCYKGATKRVGRGAVQTWIRKGATLGSCSTDLSMNVGAPSLNEVLGEAPSELLIELGAYPNPTQGETVIRFSSGAAGPASVGVISPNGVRLASLFDGEIEANVNNEVRYNTSQLPSGMYIIRMVTAGEVKNLKLMVKK